MKTTLRFITLTALAVSAAFLSGCACCGACAGKEKKVSAAAVSSVEAGTLPA